MTQIRRIASSARRQYHHQRYVTPNGIASHETAGAKAFVMGLERPGTPSPGCRHDSKGLNALSMRAFP